MLDILRRVAAAALPVTVLMGGVEAQKPVPLRTAAGEPLVAIYFFPHWWDPWKSSDEKVLEDMRLLRAMGINTLLIDHEWSQMIDGNWRLLDRAHRLAKEAGLLIMPWLSAKTWSDMGDDGRPALVREQYGVELPFGIDQLGRKSVVQPWSEATIQAGAAYAKEYLDRYERDGALLHVRWPVGAPSGAKPSRARGSPDPQEGAADRVIRGHGNQVGTAEGGEVRPVVALTVELAWGNPASFDDATNAMFKEWVRGHYGAIEAVNRAWGTSYEAFGAIDPRDASVFDYANHPQGQDKHPHAVEDHIEFRAQVVNDSLERQKALLRKTWPQVLIASEFPYQIASQHPHAIGYRIAYGANPTMADHADLLFLRMTGLMSPSEKRALREYVVLRRKPVILAYRTYANSWGLDANHGGEPIEESARLYSDEAAEWGNGLGFYSFNEMVDTHIAPGGAIEGFKASEAQSRLMHQRVRAIVARYRRLCGRAE